MIKSLKALLALAMLACVMVMIIFMTIGPFIIGGGEMPVDGVFVFIGISYLGLYSIIPQNRFGNLPPITYMVKDWDIT